MNTDQRLFLLVLLGSICAATTQAAMLSVRVTVENLSPTQGMYLSSVWGGFHDGTFDYFDAGSAVSSDLEALAEDGNFSPIMGTFTGSSGTYTQGMTAFPPPQAPGETRSFDVMLDDTMMTYFSYAAMAVPSNDAFIGNDSGMAFQVIDDMGNFMALDFTIAGATGIWDAGTEVNDEVPMNTAFLGQMTPNTGDDQNSVVAIHSGHMPGGNILMNSMFTNADFKQGGFNMARITVTEVPEPETYAAFAGVLSLGMVLWRRRRS